MLPIQSLRRVLYGGVGNSFGLLAINPTYSYTYTSTYGTNNTWTTTTAAVAVAAASTTAFLSSSAAVHANDHDHLDTLPPLSPQEFRAFNVKDVQTISHNTSKIVLQLPEGQSLQLPVASCVMIKAPGADNGKDVAKPYTPVTTNRDLGHFDFVIKKYPNGKVSGYTTSLKPGDKVEIKGPFAKIKYAPNWKKQIGMLAGGTGITPMLQILLEALNTPEDKTEYTLVFANISEEDILLKTTIEELAAAHKNLKVHYVLEKPPQGWNGSVGYINKDIITKYMPAPSNDSLVFVCGPPPMMKAISGDKKSPQDQGELTGLLKELGYESAHVFKF